MKRQAGRCFILLFSCFVLALAGLQTAQAEVEKNTLWRDAVVTELDVDFGGTGFHARWRFHRCECGDLLVQVEQVAPDSIQAGELLMVGGQVLLARGFQQQDVDIEPLVQAPSLMLQLVYTLLGRSQPEGPYAVDNKQLWAEAEENSDFKLDTGLATGTFAAPWEVKGSGWKTDSGHRRFELLFRFSNPAPGNPGQTGSFMLSGDLDFGQQVFPYAGNTALEGWSLQWLSLNERESRPAGKDITLDELRRQVKKP
jgi:hypothetical protein